MTRRPYRHSIRLPGYDYSSPGAYFITICTHRRLCLFGDVVNEEVRLNRLGRVVVEQWAESAHLREEITLDALVVMPNHVHGVVLMEDRRGQEQASDGVLGASIIPPSSPRRIPRSLGGFMAGFKSATTSRIHQIVHRRSPVWQRNYYERVLRNEGELRKAREYIIGNPAKWAEDELHPANRRGPRC